MTLPDQKLADGKVTTTITLPKQTADELKEAAKRSGIGWTQMMAVLIRRGLDEDKARSS
jgi:hypothetical protein